MPSRELDRLYTAPPAGFISSRNALAARLRKAGRTAEAAEVTRLRKPPATVWALNQVARQDPDSVKEFVEAFESLRRAQSAESADLAQAIERVRHARQHLVDQATGQLATLGGPPSPAIVRRLSATLLGAAADPQARSDLGRGHLAEELEAPGFELLAGAPRPGRAGPARRSRPPAGVHEQREAPRLRRDEQRRNRQAARSEEREIRKRHRRAEALERAAAGHRRAADKAGRMAQDLRERLRKLEQEIAEQRQAAEQSSEEADRMRQR